MLAPREINKVVREGLLPQEKHPQVPAGTVDNYGILIILYAFYIEYVNIVNIYKLLSCGTLSLGKCNLIPQNYRL